MQQKHKIILVTISIVATVTVLLYSTQSQEFMPVSHQADNCPGNIFDKSAVIFDSVTVCGTSEISQEKLSHAAGVAAQWLDNDGDGTADYPDLISTIQQSMPVIVMTKNPMTEMQSMQVFMSDDRPMQDLYGTETADSYRDAAPEEIHHIIMNAGWQKLHPDVFSETDYTSELYQTWKVADEYGHYAYDDPTCDDSCKVTEFAYLATSSYLGAKDSSITDEITLDTKEQLQEKLPEIIEIFESERYQYPTHMWPDGDYLHQANIKYN